MADANDIPSGFGFRTALQIGLMTSSAGALPRPDPDLPDLVSSGVIAGAMFTGVTATLTPAVYTDYDSISWVLQVSANGVSGWSDTLVTGTSATPANTVWDIDDVGLYFRLKTTAVNADGEATDLSPVVGPLALATTQPIEVLAFDSYAAPSASVETTWTRALNIPQTPNRGIIVVLNCGIVGGQQFAGVAIEGEPLTRIYQSGMLADGTNYSSIEVYALFGDKVPTGAVNLSVTKLATGSSVRVTVNTFVVGYTQQATPTISNVFADFQTPDVTIHNQNYTPSGPNRFCLGLLCTATTGTTAANPPAVGPNQTFVGQATASGSSRRSIMWYANRTTAEQFAISNQFLDTSSVPMTMRFTHSVIIEFANSATSPFLPAAYVPTARPADVSPLTCPYIEGAYYIDVDNGNDANSGLWTDQGNPATRLPWKTLENLKDRVFPANTTLVFAKSDEWYRRTTLSVAGAAGEEAAVYIRGVGLRLIAWGAADKRVKIGGDIAVASWAAVGSGESNGFVVANGEKATIPWAAKADHFPCIGDAFCTPAMWGYGVTAAVASRLNFNYRNEGMEWYYDVQAADIWEGTTHNYSFKISAAQADFATTQTADIFYAFSVPGGALATQYADELPIGAVVRYIAGARISRLAEIKSSLAAKDDAILDLANNRVEVWGDDLYYKNGNNPWNITGWHRDIAQAGQYGFAPVSASTRVVYAVWPTGATGTKSVTYYANVFCVAAANFFRISDGFQFGRCSQTAFRLKSSQNVRVEPFDLTQQIFLSVGDEPAGMAIYDGINGFVRAGKSTHVAGGVRFDNCLSGLQVSGPEVYDNDASTLRFGGSTNGVVSQDSYVTSQIGVHGQPDTNYEASQNFQRLNFAYIGVSRGVAMQTNPKPPNGFPNWGGKQSIFRNGIIWGRRAVGQGTNPPLGGANALLRLDNDFGGYGAPGRRALLDRLIVVNSQSNGAYLSSGSARLSVAAGGYNIGDPQFPNDNAVIRRCIFESFAIDSGAQPFPLVGFGGAPLRVENCWLSNSPVALSYGNGNAVAVNNVYEPGVRWAGALTESMWEVLTRQYSNDSNDGVFTGAYEPVLIGPSWLGWLIPAYTGVIPELFPPVPNWNRFYRNHQPGMPLFYLLKGQPGTSYSLPAGLGDNNLIALDRGVAYTLTGVRLTQNTYNFHIQTDNPLAPLGQRTRVDVITMTALV